MPVLPDDIFTELQGPNYNTTREHSSRNNLIHHRYLNYGPALFLPPLSTVSLVYQQSLLPSCLSASPSVHLSLAPLLDSSLILSFPRISLDLIIPFPIMDICGDPLYSLHPLFPNSDSVPRTTPTHVLAFSCPLAWTLL